MRKISIYKKVILSFIVCGSFILTSCLDDLNTAPIGESDYTSDLAWEEEATYTAFLAKNYAGLTLSGNKGPSDEGDLTNGDQGVATFTRGYWNLQEAPTDEVLCVWSDNGMTPLQLIQWTGDNNYVYQFFQRAMLNIGYANEYLIQTTDAKLAERGMMHLQGDVKKYREEVRALRALNYFFLMDLYGSPSFITDTEFSSFPRQISRADLFDWLESELTLIESNGILPAKDYSRMSIATVRTILTKMYLNAEVYRGVNEYDKAAVYAKKVIDAYGDVLNPNYTYFFRADNNQRTDEIIFGLPFDANYATCYGGTTFLIASALIGDMSPVENFGLNAVWSGNRARPELPSAFENGDKRYLFWETGRTKEIANMAVFLEGYSVTKFSNLKSTETSLPVGSATPSFADTDWPMFRLADVYLMYVEALVRTGSSSTDISKYFNLIRARAGISQLPQASITLDVLLKERMCELYWEGHRRTDLIRFGKFISGYNWSFKGGSIGGRNVDSKFTLYPIPTAELGANPNLKQNEGYSNSVK